MPPRITAVDDSAAGPAGTALAEMVDQKSLAAELMSRNPNRAKPHEFALYCRRVIEKAGVPDAQETRQMASHICGVVAKLPFLPDSEMEVDGKTEFEAQIEKTARRAEAALDSEMVWTASALKLSRAALELRREDPDGKKGIAWVNDPLPVERAAA